MHPPPAALQDPVPQGPWVTQLEGGCGEGGRGAQKQLRLEKQVFSPGPLGGESRWDAPEGSSTQWGPCPWVPSVFWSPSTEAGQAGPCRRVAFSVWPQGGSITPQKGAQAGVPERRGPRCSLNLPACRDTPTLVRGGQGERGLSGSLGWSHFTGGLSLPIHYLGALTALKVCGGPPALPLSGRLLYMDLK